MYRLCCIRHMGISEHRRFFWCFIIIIFISTLTYIQWIFWYTDEEKQLFVSKILPLQGAVIPGWEYGKNINRIPEYLMPNRSTTLLVGKNVCPITRPPDLLFVVCSPIGNYNYRVAIRNTWAWEAYKNYNISVAFLVGTSQDEGLNARIKNENHLYNDLIVEDFVDSKYNDTLKSAFMLKWASRNCASAKYLMKSVDHLFVNMHNLWEFINDPSKISPRLLTGKLVVNETVVRDSTSNRYMPKYMYPYVTYPDYLSGGGYLMTMETGALLYSRALLTSLVHLEDVYITGLCAEAANIERLSDFRFYYIENGNNKMDCDNLYQRDLIMHSSGLDTATLYGNYNEMNKCLWEDNES